MISIGGDTRSFGFTVVELVLVMTIAGIMLSITYVVFDDAIITTRDNDRNSDVTLISNKLESYYESSPVALGYTYPGAGIGDAGLVGLIGNNNAVTAPGDDTSSLTVATTSHTQNPSLNQYIYQPLDRDGDLCLDASVDLCARYIIWYRLEKTGAIQRIDSMRQQ